LTYSREEHPLGTGGALRLASDYLAPEFLLVNGDTFLSADYRILFSILKSFPGVGVLSAYPSKETQRPPNLRLGGHGVLTGYDRSGSPDAGYAYVDAGVGAFRLSLLESFPSEKVFSLEERVYPELVARGRLAAVISLSDFYDIGTPERLALFESFLASR